MIDLRRNKSQLVYSAVQALYWLTYGLMFAFASAYLQSAGFTNSEIGLILCFSYCASAVMQPILSELYARIPFRIERSLCCVYGIVLFLSSCLLLFTMPKALFALTVVMVFSLESAAQPAINSLAQRWNRFSPVDFGSSRGFSSVLYACMTLAVGSFLKWMPAFFLPALYLKTSGMLFCILFLVDIPTDKKENSQTDHREFDRPMKLQDRGFLQILAGITCLSFSHILIDNFMLQIMQYLGGGNAHLGIAAALAAIVEYPAMKLSGRLGKRYGNRQVLIFAGFAWTAKTLLIFLAKSPGVVYASSLLQFFSYGLYTPIIVALIEEEFPPEENLYRLSLTGTAYTVGCIIAAAIGGILIDRLGVHDTLLIAVPISLSGALLFLAGRKEMSV